MGTCFCFLKYTKKTSKAALIWTFLESQTELPIYTIDLKIRTYFEKKILEEITVADVRAWQSELLSYKDRKY